MLAISHNARIIARRIPFRKENHFPTAVSCIVYSQTPLPALEDEHDVQEHEPHR